MTDIEATLARIEERLASHVRSEEMWQRRIDETLRNIDVVVRGSHGSPGLSTRIDRLEQRDASRSKLTWIAVTAAVGALAAWVKGMVTK